jgi:(p)ppGpp synthase/HD superfamily hydrolase
MLGKAIAIASKAFEDKVDNGGQPYILHCLKVWEGVKHLDIHIQCAAILHDIVEDTDITLGDLLEEGFSMRTLKFVEYLTRDPDITYQDYIKDIANSKGAIQIKLSDLRHNSDITRLKGLSQKDFDRTKKYHRSYIYLSNILEKM